MCNHILLFETTLSPLRKSKRELGREYEAWVLSLCEGAGDDAGGTPHFAAEEGFALVFHRQRTVEV